MGEFEEGASNIDTLGETFRAGSMPAGDGSVLALTVALASRITGAADRLDVAEKAALAALAAPSPRHDGTIQARTGLALLAVHRQDAEAAGEQYSALESQQGTLLPLGAICFDCRLGLLAHATGELDNAAGHFEGVLAFCRKAGYRPELAWSLCDYADMLLEQSGDGDREAATTMLDESLQISSELGMRPLMERVLSRREILKA